MKVHGSAKQQAHLYVYLDRKACQATADKEAQKDSVYKSGHSYFVEKGEGGQVKLPWKYAVVSGSFKKTFTAHAGTGTGHEYACAYLLSKDKFGNFSMTAAHASARYTVKK